MIIIDYCQSINEVKSLMRSKEISKYYKGMLNNEKFNLMYHVVSSEILTDPIYLNYLSAFGNSVDHIIDCPELGEDFQNHIIYENQYIQKLHECNSRIFPKYLFLIFHQPKFTNLPTCFDKCHFQR